MKRILVIAGEVSGDKHGAELIAELKRMRPDMQVYAAGGELMQAAGATLLYNLVDMAVLGSVEVLRSYRRLRKIFYSLLDFVREKECDAVIFIDYPGFNIRFAKNLRRLRLPVKAIYYISPQLWAWGTRRKKTVNRCIDKMIVILPFEKDFYRDCDFQVEFVGHPMLDEVRVDTHPAEFRRKWNLREDSAVVAMLPGSRWNEVKRLLPVMLGAAGFMEKRRRDVEFVTVEPRSGLRGITEMMINGAGVEVKMAGENIYDIIKASNVVLVASGTATLETAFLLKPMVVIYRVAQLTYFLGRLLIKFPYIGLVNVIAGRRVVPEFIQHDARPEKIAIAALDLLNDRKKYLEAVEELKKIRGSLGEPGASRRAALEIIKVLEG